MKKTKQIFEILFNLAIETNKLNKRESKIIIDLLQEESNSFGLKIYSKPIDKLMSDVNDVMDSFYNFKDYPYGGKDFEYCLLERNILDNQMTEKEKKEKIKSKEISPSITFKNDDGTLKKEYYITNIKDSVDYMMKEVVTQYVENSVSKLGITEKESEYNLQKELIVCLLDFHKVTVENSEIFSKSLLNFCNPNFCDAGSLWENYPAIQNLEKNIEKQISDKLTRKDNLYDDSLYEWAFEHKYGENSSLEFDINFKNGMKKHIKVETQEDFSEFILNN